jgi:AcrR family transcriptional regulator
VSIEADNRNDRRAVRRRDAERSKSAILDAAITEFAMRGFSGTRMDEVASRAGINKSLIYQYFGSKQELYAEALNSVLKTITVKSTEYSMEFAAVDSGDNLRAYLRRYIDNHLALLEAVPEYPRLMAWENLEGGRTLSRLPLQATYRAFLGRVEDILAPLHERGLLARDFDLSQVAQGVMALTHYFVVHGGTLQHLFQNDPGHPGTRERWVNYCADMLLASFQHASPATETYDAGSDPRN